MFSKIKTNSGVGFSLAKVLKNVKSGLIRKSKLEPDRETMRPLIESTDAKVENGSTISRIILFLNVLAFVISLMGAGYSVHKYYKSLNYFYIFGGYYGSVILIITVGVYCVAAFISMMGMCWSVIHILKVWKGSLEVILHAYAWWTVGLFVMQICVILMAYSTSENIDDVLKGSFFVSMLQFQKDNIVQEKVNHMQTEMQCCGTRGHRDWFKVTWSDTMDRNAIGFPKSCCNTQQFSMKDCIHITKFQDMTKLTPWGRGCHKKLKEVFLADLKVIICITLILTGLQLSIFTAAAINIYWTKKAEVVKAEDRKSKYLALIEA